MTNLAMDTRAGRLWARRLAGLLVMLTGLTLSGGSRAWGADGHRLIAEYARSRLSPAALMQIERLLEVEPGATLLSVSTWADEARSPTTAAWHYLNFPRDGGCRYDSDRLCIKGNCVVGAIERQLAVLASAAPDQRRLLALKYVVHFVADVHQPLHAGFADDRGGNTHQLQAFGRGTNLHALWDTEMLRQWPGGLVALKAAMDRVPELKVRNDPASWAQASCRVVASAGFYPEQRALDERYLTQWNKPLVRQLAAAGQRLAGVLNAALGGE